MVYWRSSPCTGALRPQLPFQWTWQRQGGLAQLLAMEKPGLGGRPGICARGGLPAADPATLPLRRRPRSRPAATAAPCTPFVRSQKTQFEACCWHLQSGFQRVFWLVQCHAMSEKAGMRPQLFATMPPVHFYCSAFELTIDFYQTSRDLLATWTCSSKMGLHNLAMFRP